MLHTPTLSTSTTNPSGAACRESLRLSLCSSSTRCANGFMCNGSEALQGMHQLSYVGGHLVGTTDYPHAITASVIWQTKPWPC
eukprot:scaffold845_cov364-Prasinococcus_capsulatus_cf.AAC.26